MSEPGGAVPNVKMSVAKTRQESIGADVDIDLTTYVSRITGYNLAIDLAVGADVEHGKLKKIYNLSGGNIVINSLINLDGAGTDTLTISDNGFVLLIYLNDSDISERYREIDGTGYTLS